MIYDVPRNFVGDKYWRDEGLVQDGDEFEMDRGVLVQVGEVTGSMEQDLSDLLDKRKMIAIIPSSEPDSPQAPILNTARPTIAQISQLKPKSLNAVLGTPKGRIGRAALPTKSPFEQRRPGENDERSGDRPCKRLRVERPAENIDFQRMKPLSRAAMPAEEPREIIQGGPTKHSTVAHRTSSTSVENSELSRGPHALRDEENGRTLDGHLSEASGRAIRVKKVANAQSKCTKPTEFLEIESQPRPSTKAKNSQPSPATASRPVRGNVRMAIDLDAGKRLTLASDEASCQSRLQMGPRRPRKKLMYRDLLPQDNIVPKSTSQDNIHESQTSSPHSLFTNFVENERNSLSNLHQEEHDGLEARLRKQHDRQSSVKQNEPHPIGSRRNGSGKPNMKRPNVTEHRPRRNHAEAPQHSPLHDYIVPTSVSAVHHTNLALPKMDAIILSKSRPPEPHSLADRIIPVLGRPPEKPPSSPFVRTPTDKVPPLGSLRPPSPRAQVASPPYFQTQHPSQFSVAQTTESPLHDVSSPTQSPLLPIGESSKDTSTYLIDSWPSSPKATTPSNSTTPPPNQGKSKEDIDSLLLAETARESIESLKPDTVNTPVPAVRPPPYTTTWRRTLPSFKPPNARSPLKKALSDTISLATRGPMVQLVAPRMIRNEQAQTASPWSKEAWDLFGRGRDGVACSYVEFMEQEALSAS